MKSNRRFYIDSDNAYKHYIFSSLMVVAIIIIAVSVNSRKKENVNIEKPISMDDITTIPIQPLKELIIEAEEENSGETISQTDLETTKADDLRVSILSLAEESFNAGRIIPAINILKTALNRTELKNDDIITEKISEYENYYIDEALKTAEADAADENYREAVLLLKNTIDEIGNKDIRLQTLKDNYTDLLCINAEVISKALFDEEGYEQALEYLQLCNEGINAGKLNDLIKIYKAYEPVPLASLESWMNGGEYIGPHYGTMTDNYGVEYDTWFTGIWDWTGWSPTSYAVYLTEGYSTLTGVFSMRKEYNSTDTACEMWISDYETGTTLKKIKISGGCDPVRFSVTIYGVKKLKITIDSGYDGSNGEKYAFASDMYLNK